MHKTKVLHITNGFSGSTVYTNLVRELDCLGVKQIVYNPIRKTVDIGKNNLLFQTRDSEVLYRPILNHTTDRYIYPLKINKIYKDIQRQVDFSQIDFIHAHTWYSDGGVAYLLSKKYNIPYIVTVRNTDLSIYQKKLRYLHFFGRKVLSKAQNVILISASYKERVLELSSLKKIKNVLALKLKVLPNGVDPFWIENAKSSKTTFSENPFKILYLGIFSRGKNVLALQKAVVVLNEESGKKIELHLVGGGGNEEDKVLEQVNRHPSIFTFHGRIFDKSKLLEHYRGSHVFAMPSMYETFGLVYVEAMLQGLPILYTRNEGIDGFYEETIGEAVTIGDVEDIKEKLRLLHENHASYKLDFPKLKSNHDWKLIAKEYLKLYKA